LNGVSFHSARLVGPALAGLLIAWIGTGWVILTNAGCYLVLILALRLLRTSDLHTPQPAARERAMIRAGLRYLRQRPDLMTVLSIVFVGGTFGFNFGLFAPLMATQAFGKGPEEFGLLGTVFGIGSVAAALSAASRRRTRLRLLVGASVAFAVALVGSALMPTYSAYAIAVPVTGFLAVIVLTASNTLMQRGVPAGFRGRMMALYAALLLGGTTIGAPFLGWIGQTYGARWAPITGGVLTLFGTVVAAGLYRRGQWPPQPHAPVDPAGASTVKPEPSGVSTKSTVAPSQYGRLTGSTTSRTPSTSLTE
jgi:MFS family permease